MPAYRINYFRNIPNQGWVLESEQIAGSKMKRQVVKLTKQKTVRCVEVVRIR